MVVYGFDTGMAAFGWTVAEYYRVDGGIRARFLAAGVWRTEPNKDISRKGEDMSERTRALWRHILGLQQSSPNPSLICVEAVAFPFGQTMVSVVSGLGRARALVDVLAERLAVPVYEVLAREVKEAVTGKPSATKEQVCEQLEAQYPEVALMWPRLKADREHIADACGCVIAGLSRSYTAVDSVLCWAD